MKRKRKIIIGEGNGLSNLDYLEEEIQDWLSRTPAERFDFFLELSNFFCSLRKPLPNDPNSFELQNPRL
jgi:hypothetical protein